MLSIPNIQGNRDVLSETIPEKNLPKWSPIEHLCLTIITQKERKREKEASTLGKKS